MHEYTIGDKKYFQKKLVMGQWQQLIGLLKGKTLPAELTPRDIIGSLGDDIHKGVAIVLSEDGRHLKDKDIQALAEEIKFAIEPEQEFEVIEDFFACNPIASLLEKLAGNINRIVGQMTIGLSRPSSSSPEATLPEGTKSSGDTPSENASPSSAIK